ncbi:MAG: hypothetical protein ACO1OQ_12845 [Rufibacter sp.]
MDIKEFTLTVDTKTSCQIRESLSGDLNSEFALFELVSINPTPPPCQQLKDVTIKVKEGKEFDFTYFFTFARCIALYPGITT